MPIDTIYQGDFRFPKKKASLLELFLPVIHAIRRRRLKYAAIMKRII